MDSVVRGRGAGGRQRTHKCFDTLKTRVKSPKIQAQVFRHLCSFSPKKQQHMNTFVSHEAFVIGVWPRKYIAVRKFVRASLRKIGQKSFS